MIMTKLTKYPVCDTESSAATSRRVRLFFQH